MDYDPAESSPWATSPNHGPTTFQHPESPPFSSSNDHNDTFPSQIDSPFAPETGFASTAADQPQQSEQPEQQESVDDAQHVDPQDRSEGPQFSKPAASAGPVQTIVPPRAQRKQRPQFKLQAKITGLERNGRKDPILKFDVYVSLSAFSLGLF